MGEKTQDGLPGESNLDGRSTIVIRALVIGIAVVIIAGGVIVIMLSGSSASNAQDTVCELFERGEVEELSLMEINTCEQKDCEFDLSTCSFPCPLGYHSSDGICPTSCYCAAKGRYQGDIDFDSEDIPMIMKAYGMLDEELEDQEDSSVFATSTALITPEAHFDDRLPNGRYEIAYTFASSFNKELFRPAIEEAVKAYSENTCIDFVERTNQDYYAEIRSGQGCSSQLGKTTRRQQTISLALGCKRPYIIAHEFKHLLGFHHAQAHPDRDDYVVIHMNLVMKGLDHNFMKLRDSDVHDIGAMYDFTSIMHYGGYAFSINPRQPTITIKSSGEPVQANREKFSEHDIRDLNELYKCSEAKKPDSTKGSTTPSTTTTKSNWKPPVATLAPPGVGGKFPGGNPGGTSGSGGSGNPGGTSGGGESGSPDQAKWGIWGEWTSCVKTCGNQETRRRYRTCEQGSSAKSCQGKDYETSTCAELSDCPASSVNWGQWEEYGPCTKTCESGSQLRTRKCPQEYACKTGPSIQARFCSSNQCSKSRPTSEWERWGDWSECTKSCGFGFTSRMRSCLTTDKKIAYHCPGHSVETSVCNTHKCSTAPTNPAVGEAKKRIFSRTKTNVPHVCPSSDYTYKSGEGDFNGDDKVDMMCGPPAASMKVYLSSESGLPTSESSTAPMNDCGESNLFAGDFDGDGLDDMLCVDPKDRRAHVRLSKDGKFGHEPDFTHSFCTGWFEEIFPMDVNGDGKDDLVCHYAFDETWKYFKNSFRSL